MSSFSYSAQHQCEYEGCPESIRPFWISREPVMWLLCNLADSHKRPYCLSVISHSVVGLVSRRWDIVHWACILCGHRINNDRASRSTNLNQSAWPLYSSRAVFFLGGGGGQSITSLRSISPPTALIWVPCYFWIFTELRGSYRKSWATMFCKVTCFIIDKPNTPP